MVRVSVRARVRLRPKTFLGISFVVNKGLVKCQRVAVSMSARVRVTVRVNVSVRARVKLGSVLMQR